MALSLFICQQATLIGVGSLRRPGPGLLAFGAGAGIGLLALAVFIRAFLSKPAVDTAQEEKSGRRVKFFLICTSLFVYAAVISWFGFVVSTFLFVLFLLRTVQTEKGWRSLLKALLITAGTYLVFVVWLGIRLPGGFWAR
jgi:hypothetical protein